MRSSSLHRLPLFLLSSASLFSTTLCLALLRRDVDVARLLPISSLPLVRRSQDAPPLVFAYGPSPTDSPPISIHALRDKAYLPAQIGGIVGAYAFSLVVVALVLVLLAKRRREHLQSGEFLNRIGKRDYVLKVSEALQQLQRQDAPVSAKGPQYPLPQAAPPVIAISRAPGVDPTVDQTVVQADRKMAQAQLEEMYKYVMEHEEAKLAGVEPPPISPISNNSPISSAHDANENKHYPYLHQKTVSSTSTTAPLVRKDKPAKGSAKASGLTLNLGGQSNKEDHRAQTSRTSSILSALRSPLGKKKMQGMNISSPIMTPMSGTFPRGAAAMAGAAPDSEELHVISPRHYVPLAPPPVPRNQQPYAAASAAGAPLTPDMSPLSTDSIDQRMGDSTAAPPSHSRVPSREPTSAVSQSSATPLLGLPTSPKPGVNRFPALPTSPRDGGFPSLPASPRDGSFARGSSGSMATAATTATTAARTGGALPLRAYEPALTSPSYITHQQTKQTVFERNQPLSPSGAQTPWTGAPVPYTPYQPFSPVIPMSPSLVTKADRKRMRRLEPKTPTMEMVQSIDDAW